MKFNLMDKKLKGNTLWSKVRKEAIEALRYSNPGIDDFTMIMLLNDYDVKVEYSGNEISSIILE